MKQSEEQIKTYQIRYNTQSTDDSNRWRLITDGEETLVSNIIINTQTKTTKDFIEGVGDKWHVTCDGILNLKDGVAYIETKRPDNVIARHLAKTVTWRIVGTLDTMFLGWIITGSLKLGLAIGGTEVLTKMVLYFFHERAWFKWGKLGR
jgi:uncharacterized membrane protein